MYWTAARPLTTIFISNADPDFYFGAEVLKAPFPPGPGADHAGGAGKDPGQMAAKMARQDGPFWGRRLAPRPSADRAGTAAGHPPQRRRRDRRSARHQRERAHRPMCGFRRCRAVVGNIAIFGNLHVWTRRYPDGEPAPGLVRAQLDEIVALQPHPGGAGPHGPPARPWTPAPSPTLRTYLQRFDAEAAKACRRADRRHAAGLPPGRPGRGPGDRCQGQQGRDAVVGLRAPCANAVPPPSGRRSGPDLSPPSKELPNHDGPDPALHYLYDPLCGWCYGAAPLLRAAPRRPAGAAPQRRHDGRRPAPGGDAPAARLCPTPMTSGSPS